MHKYIKNNKSARFELGYYLSGIIIKVPSVLYNAVITAFLIESGFSMTQIGIVWSITLFSNTILDFPTGGFADKFGRLKIYMIGMIIMGIANILYATSNSNILIIYLAAFLLGTGESQVSGTMPAWFISLVHSTDRKYIKHVFATNQMIANIVSIIFGFLIAYIKFDYFPVLLFSGIFRIAGSILLFLFFQDNKGSGITIRENLKASLVLFIRDHQLQVCSILLSLLYSFYSLYLFVWQPAGQKFGVSGNIVNAVQSIYIFSLFVGSVISRKYYLSKRQNQLSLLLLCTSFFLIILSKYLWLYLLGIVIYGISYGIATPYVMSQIQLFVKDKYRSSLTSLISSVSSLFLIILQVFIGHLIDKYSYHPVLILSTLFMVISIFCVEYIEKFSDNG
ncbi:MAG: MFS transporter [Erysipelotrichaceae bacterium]|jgi:MFS family permease|nr:MFS transporter [Erysipelotrichaceae bacterium]MCH4044680.1 MFS transporter [Erysipelotrichaceae bacterium]MCH4121892.1 MFS transporter [Erysipelotrichaceae bacterium]